MSVSLKINEVEMNRFLNGPVRNVVREKAEEVVTDAKIRAGVIMHRHPIVTESIGYEITSDGDAVIGIRDGEGGQRFLAEKEERENVWLIPAMRKAFPFNSRRLLNNGR